MRLTLLRHGHALDASQDAARPLSDLGRAHAGRTGAALSVRQVAVGQIWHSTKVRAQQTAQEVALHVPAPLLERQGLGPDDPVEIIALQLQGEQTDTLLVGHLPFLADLARRLGGDQVRLSQIAFPSCGVVELRRDGPGAWTVIGAWACP
jgi:phosphohistidine phosphatase